MSHFVCVIFSFCHVISVLWRSEVVTFEEYEYEHNSKACTYLVVFMHVSNLLTFCRTLTYSSSALSPTFRTHILLTGKACFFVQGLTLTILSSQSYEVLVPAKFQLAIAGSWTQSTINHKKCCCSLHVSYVSIQTCCMQQ